MYGLKKMLIEEQKRLQDIIRKAKEGEETFPEGYLRISSDKGHVRFYHCVEDRLGKYIQLAQKTYQEAVIHIATGRLKQISRLLADYADDEIEQIYLSSHAERQALITPLEPTTDKLIYDFQNETYKGKEFQEGVPVILTEKGERVRSKSEKILADYFFRKEIYWEHEGRMDDPVYARNAVKKIYGYEQNGLFEGERLILTYETEETVINTKDIERKLNQCYR